MVCGLPMIGGVYVHHSIRSAGEAMSEVEKHLAGQSGRDHWSADRCRFAIARRNGDCDATSLHAADGLGLFCGAVVAKVLGKFLAPQIQSHLTVFLGGITTGNIGSSGAGLHKLITGVADQINKLVTLIPASAGDISAATTLGLWIALLTALVILGANAYYANQQSSPVGNRVEKFAAGPAVPSAMGESPMQG